MNACDVKQSLRRRHPAKITNGSIELPGAWTVIEEFEGIDLLAISANKKPPSGALSRPEYPWVGYEVKVSRSDLRREILDPGKRYFARRMCHEFYFAVPKGLLSKEELDYKEPGFSNGDFSRKPCPRGCRKLRRSEQQSERISGANNKSGQLDIGSWSWSTCETCEGRGYLEKSRVEMEAPTLFIPNDVGLIEVTESKCVVTKKSPISEIEPLTAAQAGALVRWVSLRPDPRHNNMIEDLAEKRSSMRLY